jgi:GNAT superfamily N-acetyltransferase
LLRGSASREYGTVHARLRSFRRGTRRRPFSALHRMLARILRALLGGSLYARLRTLPMAHAIRGIPQRLRTLPIHGARRTRALGNVAIRLLAPQDGPALERFAHAWLPHLTDMFNRQLPVRWQREGIALGAFSGTGDIVGFVFLDEYSQEGVELEGMWVRALKVVSPAQRLGIGSALIRALCEEAAARGIARIYADINENNTPSLKLFRALGFVDAPQDVAERLNREFEDPEQPRRMVAVVRTLR